MKHNHLLAALLALWLLLTMTACPALSEAEDQHDYDEVFVIVHTNDVHGFIDVEPYVKAVADDMKAEYGDGNVITVSAGDVFSGGNAVAHLYNGAYRILSDYSKKSKNFFVRYPFFESYS